MSNRIPKPHEVCSLVTGKIRLTISRQTGESTRVVYQRVRRGLGNAGRHGKHDIQIRTQPKIIDTKTQAQLDRRAKFKAAVQAWQQLSDAEIETYRRRAKQLELSGYNLFLREQLKK